MICKTLSSIIDKNVHIHGADVDVNGLALDSRLIKNGMLFFATKGEVNDGHLFIRQAIKDGASAIAAENKAFLENEKITFVVSENLKEEIGFIAARFYDEPTKSMQVTGVTGTNGKTSISSYIEQLLHSVHKDCGVIGTLGIQYQDKFVKTKNTTPDAITLQHHFYEMANNNVMFAVMEVSSHALAQHRCNGIQFDTAILSNITHDHLDYHGTFSDYVAAKLKLFSVAGLRVAIVNYDSGFFDKVKETLGDDVKLITYSSRNALADVYLGNIVADSQGFSATLHYFDKQYPVSAKLLGEFNLANMLAAIIAVAGQGFSLSTIVEACAHLKPVSGRMQVVDNSYDITAVVDYAHTPDALENVLKSLRAQVSGKIIVVFGCGGDRDKSKRPVMGKVVEANADFAIITADNPRSESIETINNQIASGFQFANYQIISDRQSAIAQAVAMAKSNDCILVAGKGHEKTQIIGSEIKPFDDVEMMAAAFRQKKVAVC